MAFGFFGKKPADEVPVAKSQAEVEVTADGLSYRLPGVPSAEWLATPFAYGESAELGARLSQLYMDGLGRREGEDYMLPWNDVYALLDDPEHQRHAALLHVPPIGVQRPVLNSQGSLSDAGFRVVLTHWVDGNGAPCRQQPKSVGAALKAGGKRELVSPAVWALLQQLRDFHAAPPAARDAAFNEQAWARMRRWAVASHTPLSDYLDKTIIVTPEKLRIDVNRVAVGDDRVLTVVPGFEGAPEKWMDVFDRMPIQHSYSVPDGKSMTKVVLSEPVRQVLAQIKRMPGRKVAGAQAEALVRNPFAALGPAASEVVDAAQVEQALVDAGVSAQRFSPDAVRNEKGQLQQVRLLVETVGSIEDSEEVVTFDTADALKPFCDRLQSRIAAGHQWCGWKGNDFELVPEAEHHLSQLQAWLAEWRYVATWGAGELLNLSNYSSRVSEFGVEKPYAMPFVQRRSVELDWFLDNVLIGLVVRKPGTTQTTLVSIDQNQLAAAEEAVNEAAARGQEQVLLPGAPVAVPVDDARRAIDDLKQAVKDIKEKRFDPEKPRANPPQKVQKQQLVLKSNIDVVEHVEERMDLLSVPAGTPPRLPKTLRPTTDLKPHQHDGVAMLQHLWTHSPHACRGCLLADDMGLGKTLQLLTFIAHCVEQEPTLPPVLVVAPVALLENWKSEIDKFFEPGALSVLTLYGAALKALRLPPAEIDPGLSDLGITKLLRKGWADQVNIVLTTYETLRDLEFTLAAQDWSIMVCDEAQKIKNPSAMVTRSAKKQKVRFRVACTGTPVENTLLDLWCLFDFVQPGLLGALSQFQRTYKQPIEAKTEQQKLRVAELRRLIEPQTLRRTKQGVAGDILPKKLEDDDCRTLPMSPSQLTHYWAALERMKQLRETNPSAVLQALHHIRRTCSDPHWQQPDAALRMPIDKLLTESPKLGWMVQQLDKLRAASDPTRGEKVIIFCEFRDLQVLLQRVIRERFDLDVFVINGDTSASSEVENSRQKLIDRFQRSKGFNAIVLSPLAVGFGVNIQEANHVIHFTRTWNPAKEDQATDRAYRIGQDRDVRVYYPSVVGDGFESFDSVLHKLLTWKRGIAGDMLNASGELSTADFAELQ